MTPPALAFRTYARYVAPLTLLAGLIYAPLIAYGWLSKVPNELAPAWRMVMVAWSAAGTAWIAQYMLVGGAAPLARALVAGRPLSQLAALRASTRGLARAILPVLLVVAAVAMGSIALAVPGLVLGVLLALTGASTEGGLAEPLRDSVTRVRANLRPTIVVVIALLVLDFAVVTLPFVILLGPLTAKPSADELAAAKRVLEIVSIGLPVVTPLAACALAAVAVQRD